LKAFYGSTVEETDGLVGELNVYGILRAMEVARHCNQHNDTVKAVSGALILM
jgi:hypothetical protein